MATTSAERALYDSQLEAVFLYFYTFIQLKCNSNIIKMALEWNCGVVGMQA